MTITSLYHQLTFFVPVVAIVSLSIYGCSFDLDETNESSEKSQSIVQINAERGDACECISNTLDRIDAFIVKMNSGEYTKSLDLNAALSDAIKGCMTPTGHQEADAAWSISMSGCESFLSIREAMIIVSQKAAALKQSEQEELSNQTEGNSDAAKILNRLSHKNK
jgi:hypothetical protein